MFRIIHMNIQTLLFWKKTESEEDVQDVLDTQDEEIFKNSPYPHKRGRIDVPYRLLLNQVRQSYHPNINTCYSNSARNLVRRTPVQIVSSQQPFSMVSIVESLKRVMQTISAD